MTTKWDLDLADKIGELRDDPLGYVMFMFPWGTDESIQMAELREPYASRFGTRYGPDIWQCEFLDQLGEETKKNGFDGRTAVDAVRRATASGHGTGLSTMQAWLIKFILDTRPYSAGVLLSLTSRQSEQSWAELQRWHQKSKTNNWFTMTDDRLSFNDYPDYWGCSRMYVQGGRPFDWEKLAGFMRWDSTVFYIFDEAANIPMKYFVVREGSMVDGEPMVFDFGLPRGPGAFMDNFKPGSGYTTRNIDSRDVQITNKAQLNQWADDYGEDNDFFKVRVRGVFPGEEGSRDTK